MDVEVGIKEAKNNLSRLVAAAQKGRRVYLMNRGKRVAQVVPISTGDEDKRGRGMFKEEIRLPAGWGSQKQREQWEKDFLNELEQS